MEVEIIKEKIGQDELKKIARAGFGEMIKVVVDVERKILALGGELHADGEAVLIADGSRPENLWGANIYLGKPKEERIEFSALINIRPSVNNRSMEIQKPETKEKIKEVIDKLIE